jgi:hypothetical protein
VEEPLVVFNRVTKELFPDASCAERADGNKLVLTPSILKTSIEEGRRARINLRKRARARVRPGLESLELGIDEIEGGILAAAPEAIATVGALGGT